MDRDLLKNTENVVPSLDPLCSDIESENLKELDDVTLLKSITGLALRMSILWLRLFVCFLCLVFCLC